MKKNGLLSDDIWVLRTLEAGTGTPASAPDAVRETMFRDQGDSFPLADAAGSVFVGPFSPEAAGDYASGPNHVLPTSGSARVRGGLSVWDYVKVISVQHLSVAGLNRISKTINTLARAEGLEAHARSARRYGSRSD